MLLKTLVESLFPRQEVHQAGYVERRRIPNTAQICRYAGTPQIWEGIMFVNVCNTSVQQKGLHLKRNPYLSECPTGCLKFTEINTVPLVLQFRYQRSAWKSRFW